MAFFATFALVFILIIKPQEIWPVLNALRLLDVFTGLAALGVIIDFATGKQKNAYTPQLPHLGLFLGSCYVSTVILLGRVGFAVAFTRSTIAAVFMLVVMYGARSFSRLRALIMVLVGCAAFVSVVAVQQGQVDPVCIELPTDEAGMLAALEDGIPDGRSCDTAYSCTKNGKMEMDYACERLGWFATVSTERRVRWRGQLADPNELSVFIGAVFPLLLAVVGHVRKTLFSILALAVVGLGLYAVILTQSRGGQLVIGTVFGIDFVSRFGAKGVLGAVLLALPVVLLGGREGSAADASSDERLSLLYDGANMVAQHPLLGVGIDQFGDNTKLRLTAHNAYLLAASELGFPGFFLWTSLLWSSMKIPLTVVRRPPPSMDSASARSRWRCSSRSSGWRSGFFFLSFTFKQLLFVWFGMAGALYGIVRQTDPTFQVKLGAKDFIGIALFDVSLIDMIFVYTRLKGGG